MKRPLPLATRTFLAASLPACLALAASFYGVSAAIRQELKRGLKESLYRNEAALDRVSASF